MSRVSSPYFFVVQIPLPRSPKPLWFSCSTPHFCCFPMCNLWVILMCRVQCAPRFQVLDPRQKTVSLQVSTAWWAVFFSFFWALSETSFRNFKQQHVGFDQHKPHTWWIEHDLIRFKLKHQKLGFCRFYPSKWFEPTNMQISMPKIWGLNPNWVSLQPWTDWFVCNYVDQCGNLLVLKGAETAKSYSV